MSKLIEKRFILAKEQYARYGVDVEKALRNLATAATRIVGQLKPLAAQAKDDSEVSSFDQLVENADSIIQAANKLKPAPTVEKKEKTKAEKTK